MTEATQAPTRTHNLHTYAVLSPDWLTEHQPRTMEHLVTGPDGTQEMSLMSEIGDGVFVAWSSCRRCSKHFTACSCPEGPKEPEYITGWRDRRFGGSFDTRSDLGADRQVTAKVIATLRDRGYAIGEIPPPERVEVQVPDHSLFVELFNAAAACEAPEESQLDEVLGDFQARYDEITGHVSEDTPADEGDELAALPEPSELERVALAPVGTPVPIDLEIDDDF